MDTPTKISKHGVWKRFSGWWFGTWLLFSIIYGMSSTNQFSFFNYSWCKLTNFDTFSNSGFSFDLKLETCILFLELNIDPGEFGHKSSLWQRGRIFLRGMMQWDYTKLDVIDCNWIKSAKFVNLNLLEPQGGPQSCHRFSDPNLKRHGAELTGGIPWSVFGSCGH